MNEWMNEWNHTQSILLEWHMPYLWTFLTAEAKHIQLSSLTELGFLLSCTFSRSLPDAHEFPHFIFMPSLRVGYILSISQMGKVGPREIKLHARGHTARKLQSADPDLTWQTPKLWVLSYRTPPSPEPPLSWVSLVLLLFALLSASLLRLLPILFIPIT